ncbi:MAG: hypothetical protein V3T54_03785 [Acidobacteriota bacterium]
MKLKNKGMWVAVLAVGWMVTGEALAQCAMCGTALGSPEDPLTRGILWSALFLVSIPLALVGSIGGWLYLAFRRASPRGPRGELLGFREDRSGMGQEDNKEVDR